ncbi:hypothetical protein IMZ31_10850 [Pontibacillus sp. ALD_SL1]|uniref:hypothetical protein n=1 Tax=Pontibacillus sp. ALD_SL1 TaxID=2777185 RepID=UPI001A96A924|nr:hypothetical protein [Pontibacillus sp. ALD_SL1]QSS98609.1 hypothetical protein IMZ31_10850 [Pontibacillus sp. ALD_SL1]
MDQVYSLVELWDIFKLAILVSLVGALIGHYKRNACILLPIVSIDFKFKGFEEWSRSSHRGLIKALMLIVTIANACVSFLLFLVGIRYGDNKNTDPILFELGVIGDLIIGVGAGIIAKSTVTLTGTENQLSIIVTSLLAGYAGLSYIQKYQKESLENACIDYEQKLACSEEDRSPHVYRKKDSSDEIAATKEP